VGLNVLVFGAMVVAGISPFHPDAQQVLRWGADFGPFTLHGEWWRLGTSMFLHFGLLHLALNMWALFNLGLLAEPLLGSRAFLALYLLSGVGGSLASVLVHPLAVGGGASGAIFGVAGGLIASMLLKRRGSENLHAIRQQLPGLAMFVVYNLFFGFGNSGIDNMAHLGGLAVGAAFCSALALLPTGERT
jgi:rhomboid protease GluP